MERLNVPAVLITGARAPAALDLGRVFAAAGYAVHMADCAPIRMAELSRMPSGVHAYASPVRDRAAFERDILRLAAGIRPALIVPVCEEVFHLAALADRTPELAAILYAPNIGTLRTLHSKRLFAEACAELGLRAPKTWSLESPADIAALPETRELVFKPEFSRFGVHTLIRPDADTLATLSPSPQARWVAQRHISGVEVSFYAACRDGRLNAFSAYGSTWRSRGGTSYAFEVVAPEVARDLAATASILAARVKVGQFACDAIVDADGQAWLLECNPRATSGVHLFARDPALARAMTGEGGSVHATGAAFSYLAPAYWLFGLPEALREGRLDAWKRGLREGHDVIGAPGDGLPVLGAMADSLRFGIQALATRQGLSAAMTEDIEWNGEPL